MDNKETYDLIKEIMDFVDKYDIYLYSVLYRYADMERPHKN